MGTRGVIARAMGDGWAGRYHHWDSYPSGLGARLYEVWHEYKGDTRRMLAKLVDAHPVGWSTILGCNIKRRAGYREIGTQRPGEPARFTIEHDQWERTQGPQCYCHGDRHEKEAYLIESTSDPAALEWAYAISEERPVMTVFRASGRSWVPVAVVRLDGPEPDWQAME